MDFLCPLVFGVIAFAAVGHFLWWMMVETLKAIFKPVERGEDRPNDYRPPSKRANMRDCPACGAACNRDDVECPFCGFQLRAPTSRELGRVRTAEAEVESLANAGDLDPATAKTVLAQLQRRARVIQGLPVEPSKPARASEPEPLFALSSALASLPAPVEPPPPISLEPLSSSSPEPISLDLVSEPAPEPISLDSVAEPVGFAPAIASPSFLTEAPPEPPQRGSVFAAFMEERNILWGELVGGLLIVGCSIALLVTQWQRLEAFPYFPFLLSGAITLALYGAGQYTLHHWKLTATSLGLLVISMLLTPLDLLLLTDPITRGELSLLAEAGTKLLAVLLFAWVVRGGGRDVLTAHPEWRWWLALAVVGPPTSQLLPDAWFGGWATTGSVWVALASFAGACLVARRSLGTTDVLDRPSGAAVLQFVGLAVFSLAAAWGLHVAQSLDVAARVIGLAVPLVLAGAVVIEAGLTVAMRVKDGGPRATGTAVALSGLLVMTAGFTAGWSEPLSVLLGAGFVGFYFNRVAFAARIPASIGLAVPSIALALVVGYFGLVGRWGEPLARLLGTAESGAVLAGFSLVLAVVAELLARRGTAIGPVSYAFGAVGAGLAALFLANANGLDHPLTATAVHAACAVGLLASNVRWRLRALSHGGLWVVLIGSLWAVYAAVPHQREVWAFAVALEALGFAILSLGMKGYHTGAAALLRRAGRDVSLAAVILAPVLALFARGFPATRWDTGTLFVLSFTGLALARLTGKAMATYFAASVGFLAFVHLALARAEWEPVSRTLWVAVLTHATLALLAAIALRRLERVFSRPLRTTAMASSLAGILVLFAPAFGHGIEWAGGAVWLGLIWLTLALVWRERSDFAVFQMALSLAAVLCGVAWIDWQGWWPTRSVEYLAPAALQVYAVSLGLLGVGWVFARRLLHKNAVARQLWTEQPMSAERVLLAVLVAGQFMLAALAVIPEVQSELMPVGWITHRVQSLALRQAFGSGAWVMLGMLALTLVASWRLARSERDTDPHLIGLMLLFLSVPVVWAGTFHAELATASALRWGLGAAFALGTVAVAVRVPLRRGLDRLGFPTQTLTITKPSLLVMLGVAAVVVVFVSGQVAQIGLTGKKPSGPLAGSMFATMGMLPSNLIPLVLVVFGLGCSAARERSPGYAFAGGWVFTTTIAAGYALAVITSGVAFDSTHLLRVGLLACSGAAVWALVWLATERRVTGGRMLDVQSLLGLGGLSLLAVLAAFAILSNPGPLPTVTIVRDIAKPIHTVWDFGWLGWGALALGATAALWHWTRTESGLKFHIVSVAALIAGVLTACAFQTEDFKGKWLAFHTLACAWALVGFGLAIASRQRHIPSYWLDGMAGVLTVFALRVGTFDPYQPWLPASLALLASVILGMSAVLNRCSFRMGLSGLLVNLAAILVWMTLAPDTISGCLLANAAALASATLCWTLVTKRSIDIDWSAYLDYARVVSLGLLWLGLSPTFAGERVDPAWLTWCATVIVAISMLTATVTVSDLVGRVGVFLAGTAFVLLGVSETTSQPVWDVWQAPLTLAAYVLLASTMWAIVTSLGHGILKLPRPKVSIDPLAVQAVVAAVVILVGLRLSLRLPDLLERLAAGPFAVLLLFGAAALLVRAVPTWANMLRFAVVALGVLVFATTAWAVPDPAGSHLWLHRTAWLFVALVASGFVGCSFAPRLGENWRTAVNRTGGVCAALAVLVLGVNLTQQVPVFDPIAKHTPLEPAAVFAMLLGVLATIVLALRFALSRGRDPLDMPDHRRTLYVYLAEVLVVLFFTHMRFNAPELFMAGAVRYWTFAVMAIAFVIVGLAELFERRKLHVLATPLRRTGVLVPLIPLLAFWAKPPAFLTQFATNQAPGLSPLLGYLEKLPQHFDTYAWLWFLAGALYGLVALWRNSFGWALLAAITTNAALWSLLTYHDVPFAVHPQVWVIPLALIVLVSEHINRAKLRREMSDGLRYLGVGMIYLASSADMFIAGAGQSVWLPVILAVFCVVGVLAGIMMRVRAFVFLGVGFLMLDLFAMIWHAAVNLQQTWVWYVSGIVLGVAILTLFAVFEKRKRHDDTREGK